MPVPQRSEQFEAGLLFKQLGIPIGDINRVEERHPFLVAGHAEGFLHERRPLRFKWLANQRHVRLMGRPTAFAMIALMARADDIFPN